MLPKYKDIIDLIKKGSTIEAQEKIMSLREGALELQEENQELKSKIRELEAELRATEHWTKEKEKYALANPWGGPAQVYALKKDCSDGEQPHYICTNCFHKKIKVILNPVRVNVWMIMTCPTCNAKLGTGNHEIGEPKYFEDINKID